MQPSAAPSEDHAVRLRGVTKRYASGTAALGPLDLDIRRGEFVALLGASGCGKSTALQLIAGLMAPSAGRIEVITPEARPRIGFVFQEPTLMPWCNIRDNVRLPLTLAHVAETESALRSEQALAEVGLAGFADAYPRELSGGMKMRASLARALVTAPDILLMDEPFAALDEITRFRLNDDLLAVWQRLGTTVIFVTHSVFESVYLSQRVVVLTTRPGRVSAQIVLDPAEPRNDAYRTSAPYAQACRVVSEALLKATGTGAGA